MIRFGFGVLADDLTGAHAAAARLAQQGRRAAVVWDPADLPRGFDALVADMRTRDRVGGAKGHTTMWARALLEAGCDRLELRVDTTLRGDPAGELQGVLAALSGPPDVIAAVTAYPTAGRLTRGTRQSVKNSHEAEYNIAVAERLFPGQRVASVGLDALTRGVGYVTDWLEAHMAAGVCRFLFDAAEESHLGIAAGAVEALCAHGLSAITVSSGAWLRYYPARPVKGFVLAVLASPTETNRRQLETLARGGSVRVVTSEQVLSAPFDVVSNDVDVVVIHTFEDSQQFVPAERAAIASSTLMWAAENAGYRCRGLVVTGGDAASRTLEAIGATGLSAVDEPLPLCAQGVVVGGRWPGLPVVTKGGVIGDARTLAILVDSVRALSPEPDREANFQPSPGGIYVQ